MLVLLVLLSLSLEDTGYIFKQITNMLSCLSNGKNLHAFVH